MSLNLEDGEMNAEQIASIQKIQSDLRAAKRKRAPTRTTVTKCSNALRDLLSNATATVQQFNVMINHLQDKHAVLKELDGEIMNLLLQDETVDDAAICKEVEEVEHYDDIVREGILLAKEKITPSTITTLPTAASPAAVQVKLPKYEMETFSGDVFKWTQWRESFSITIDAQNMPILQKFTYLRQSLKGSAAAEIDKIELTASNYPVALKALEERFGQPHIILAAHAQSVNHLAKVDSAENIKGLRVIYDTCSSNIRGMKQILDKHFDPAELAKNPNGIYNAIASPLLSPLILDRIPQEIAIAWSRQAPVGKEYDLDLILAFIKKECEARENLKLLSPDTVSSSSSSFKRTSYSDEGRQQQSPTYSRLGFSRKEPQFMSRSPYTGRTLAATQSHSETQSNCDFCDGGHSSFRCKKVYSMPQEQIYATVKHSKLCLNCFGSHFRNQCKSKGRCKTCSKSHHSLLHRNEGILQSQNSYSSNTRINQQKKQVQFHQSSLPVRPETIHENQMQSRLNSVQRTFDSNPACTDQTSEPSANASTPLHLTRSNIQFKPHEATTSASGYSCESTSGVAYMQTALVHVEGTNARMEARIFLDEGSDFSYVRSDIIQQVGSSPVGSVAMRVNILDEVTTQAKIYPIHKLRITGVTWGNTVTIKVLEREKLMKPLQRRSLQHITDQFPHLKGLDFADNLHATDLPVQILIGLDNLDRIKLNEPPVMDPRGYGISAHKTMFGWIVRGWTSNPYEDGEEAESNSYFIQLNQEDDLIQSFWKLESIGIESEVSKTKLSEGDELAIHQLSESITQENGRYKVGLPWKPEAKGLLVSNRESAFWNFKGILRRLQNDPQLATSYVTSIKTFKDNQFCEPAPLSSIGKRYLPHHPVLRPDKTTTKCRPVFNGSYKKQSEISLNDALLNGPNLCPEIFDLLVRFRTKEVALTADVQQAFLQILMKEDDREYLRFFWVDKDDIRSNVFSEQRMCVLPFGLGPSPFILSFVLSHHLKRFKDPDISRLPAEIYVDDLVTGRSDFLTAYSLKQKAIEAFSMASMNLRSWKSNNLELRDEGQEPNSKVLGLPWNMNEDTIKIEIHNPPSLFSKRTVLGFLAKVYDPCGLVSPGLVKGKILMRQMWKLGLSWDDPLSPQLTKDFHEWFRILKVYCAKSFQRFVGNSNEAENVQLHCFTDASVETYACCIYLRISSVSGVRVSLLSSRTRLSPTSKTTVPKLELLGLVLGSRLVKRVRETLSLDHSVQVFGWSDSTIALAWTRGDPTNYTTFVANRVREIQQSNFIQWNHVDGINNPADLASRGNFPTEKDLNLWHNGPPWMKMPESNWPIDRRPQSMDTQEVLEYKEELRTKVKESVIQATLKDVPFIDAAQYSSWKKLLKVTAWLFRPFHNKKLEAGQRNVTKVLSSKEIEDSRWWWIRQIQNDAYPQEIASLHEKVKVGSKSQLFSFRPFVDDKGILRMGSRTAAKHDLNTYEERNLILLPAAHPAVRLLVEFTHQKAGHQGLGSTLSELRKEYWIVKARNFVKSLLHRCTICKRFNSFSYNPETIMLPKFRVTEARPFSITGCDYAGPLYLSNGNPVYICLFTCASVRAIHLELVSDQTTETFLRAFRRFNARRGPVTKIFTDNAKTFKGAVRFLVDMNVSPHFIPDRSPHWGGWWERMVKATKQVLRKTLGKASLLWDELHTVLVETERLINNRPLTVVTDDPQDIVPITPSHFLGPISFPDGEKEAEESSTRDQLTKRLRYRYRIASKLWDLWQKEYLFRLHQWPKTKNQKLTSPQINDIVIVDPETTRNRAVWPLGRVIHIIKGRDGVARAADVLIQTGKVIRRSSRKLFPLEFSCDTQSKTPLEDQTNLEENQIVKRRHTEKEISQKGKGVIQNREEEPVPLVATRRGRVVRPPVLFNPM